MESVREQSSTKVSGEVSVTRLSTANLRQQRRVARSCGNDLRWTPLPFGT